MGFKDLIAKSQASGGNDGDYFFADTKGTIEITQMKHVSGFKGDTVVLEGRVLSCEATVAGAKTHAVGAKVKKLYLLTKYPEVAPGMLKRDILNITGGKEDEVSAKDMEALLDVIFENEKSEGFGLKGVKANYTAKNVDRSAKGKTPITAVYFSEAS